jgi:uncharacterized repeat protein (TIGR01451 family)
MNQKKKNCDSAFCYRQNRSVNTLAITLLLLVIVAFSAITTLEAASGQQTNVTVEIKSWDVIGIDANKPTTEGPNQSIVQARICNTGSFNATNVTANFTWDSSTNQEYIFLHPNEQTVKNLGTIQPDECNDVFFVVEMKRDKNAKDKTRSYTINVTSDNSNSPNARQTLTVKGLIEQSQNQVIYVNISNTAPQICTHFEVYVWANSTRNLDGAGWPVGYDPGVIELVNVTINTDGTLIRHDLYNTSNISKTDSYITYTFHAIGPGTTNINPLIQDHVGANYQYNANFDTVGIPPIVIRTADIEVNKTVDNRTTYINETVTFNVTATNNGPNDATGVIVTEVLPIGLTYVSHDECPCTSYDPLTGVWNIGDLANGSSVYLALTAKVTRLDNLTNNVTKTAANEYDPDTSNDQDNATVNSQPSADIEVVKLVDNPNPNVGDNITYTIEVTNNGPNNATGLNITDGLTSAGFTYVSNTSSHETYNSNTGLWRIDTLEVGAYATLNITVTVTQSGFITNTAELTASDQFDPDSTPNNHLPDEDDQDYQTIYVPYADIAINKSVSNERPNVGETILYTITATNNGPDGATGLEVTEGFEGLPTGLEFVSHEECNCSSYDPGTNIWDIGDLANGSSVTLNITANVTQPGFITNFANKTALNEDDPNTANDQDNQTIYVPAADIDVNKTVNNSAPNVGTNVIYTITVTNTGPDNASGVVLDLLPQGIIHVSNSTSQGNYTNSTGIWDIGSLANGTAATLNITANVTVNSPRTNTAELIAVDYFDPDSTPNNHDPNEDDQDSVTLNPIYADIAVEKTVNNSEPNLSQNINFTITVTNNGPSDATGVEVSDLLPSGLNHVSNYTPNGSYNDATGIWTIGDLSNEASAFLNITATVTESGYITNTAVKTKANEHDNNTTNDLDDATILVIAADIGVLKTVDNPNPHVGQTINYTITVTNHGPSNATGVEVTDLLPTELVHVSNSTPNGSYNDATGIWGIGDLSNGSSATLTITATVMQPGLITNFANKTALNETDPNPSNDNHSQIIYSPSADIEITKRVNNSTPYVGETIAFNITATNNGPDDASGVRVTDVLPPGLPYVSHEECNCTTFNPLTGEWLIGDLANGSSVYLALTARVTQLGNLTNNATKTAANEYDTNTTNDQDNETVNGQPAADIAVVKIVDNTNPNVGERITFTIEVINNGPNNATGLEITDGLPLGLTYESNTTSQGTYNSATDVWSLGNLDVGAVATLNITAIVTQPGFSTNTVELNASDQFDPDSTPNNQDPTEDDQENQTVYVPQADIEINKTVDNPTPFVGDLITYTITVINNGPDDVTNLQLKDGLPAGLIFEDHTAPAGTSYNSLEGTWYISLLENGSSATLTITVTVTQQGAIQNIAEVLAADQFDPDSTPNNQDPTEDDQDGTVILSTPISVPALTPTGLIALVGLLSAIAAMSITIKRGKRR